MMAKLKTAKLKTAKRETAILAKLSDICLSRDRAARYE
jgi:hypothetical protein